MKRSVIESWNILVRNIHPQLICEACQLRWLTKFINTYYIEHICIVFIVKNITNTTNYSLNKRITSQENERKGKSKKSFLLNVVGFGLMTLTKTKRLFLHMASVNVVLGIKKNLKNMYVKL